MRISDWSSDVCSSDLLAGAGHGSGGGRGVFRRRAAGSQRAQGGQQQDPAAMAHGLGPPLDSRHLGGRVRARQVQVGEGVTGRAVGDPQVGATPPTGRSMKSSRLKPLPRGPPVVYRSRTTQRSEEHTSELQSLMRISYAVFCLKKTKQNQQYTTTKTLTIQQ